jgi:hypothetical protein
VSSSIGKRYLRLLRSLVHPLLSIFLPLLFLLSADQLLRVLFPGVSWFPRQLAPLLLVAGIEEAVMGNLLFKERAAFAARIRELVVLLALAFGYLFMLLGVRSGRALHLSPVLIYPLTATLLQWLFSHGIHCGLRERELLLGSLTGKRGAALRHCLRDSSYQAGLTVRVLRNIKAGAIVFQIQIVALLIAAAVLKRQPTFGGQLVVSLHTIVGLLGIGMLHGFEEQQLLLGSGIPLPLALERRRVLFCLSILAITAAAVILAARNASLLPLSALIALLRKLASLFRFPAGPGWAEALQNTLIERQRYYQAMPFAQPAPVASPLALLMVEFLRRLFTTLLGTGLFLFLVFPLLSQDFIDRLRELRPFASLWRRLRVFLGFTVRFWLRFLRWLRQLRLSRRRAFLTVEDERGAAAGPKHGRIKSRRFSVRKRVQMSRVQRAFLVLTKWGEQLGVPYVFFLTPLEYSEQLSAAVPAGSGQLTYVVEVFEEVMFSTHLVAGGRIARYLRAIRSLSRLAPEGTGEAGRSSP